VLAVGQDIAPSLVLTRLGAVILALMTVLTAVPLAVVTARLGPERFGDPLPGRAFARDLRNQMVASPPFPHSSSSVAA
jgi:hypothetical protein